jgi:hypothetical protein
MTYHHGGGTKDGWLDYFVSASIARNSQQRRRRTGRPVRLRTASKGVASMANENDRRRAKCEEVESLPKPIGVSVYL